MSSAVKGWEILYRRLYFSMYTFKVQTEEECQQLIELGKEEAIVLTISQEIRQLKQGLDGIELHNKKDRYIDTKEVGLIEKEKTTVHQGG